MAERKPMGWKVTDNDHQSVVPGQSNQPAFEPDHQERKADIYWPGISPVALNITTYRFGASPEATRPDRVMRFPTAALLIQQSGRLYECVSSSQRMALPQVALLGPTCTGHIWATDPNTRFSLVNLAPGAVQALLGIDPREACERVEPLTDPSLLDGVIRLSDGGPEVLHSHLCHVLQNGGSHDWRLQRAHKAVMSLTTGEFGAQVRDYADQFGVSPRTLQRVVSRAVGLTPKQVLAIQRVRRLITLTSMGWSRSIADLAQDGGFFDQSHMRYDLQRLGLGNVGHFIEGGHIAVEH